MKDIKINDICWIIEHSVYGNQNEPLNEPKLYSVRITSIDGDIYSGYGTDTMGFYKKPSKYVFKTKEEGEKYIKEHRIEIIKESFDEHKKWFDEQIRKARGRL